MAITRSRERFLAGRDVDVCFSGKSRSTVLRLFLTAQGRWGVRHRNVVVPRGI